MRFKEIRSLARSWKFSLKKYFIVCKYPNVHNKAILGFNNIVTNPNNLYMSEKSSLKRDNVIMNGRARLVIKKWSGAAEELMVITGNHMSMVGKSLKDVTNEVKDVEDIQNEYDKDIIIDEDVWIGARVTLLQGIHIGRGCEVGAGSVLRNSIPPYSIVIGNPAKIIGFRFTPEEIVNHEKELYPEEERLPIELLEKNYEKYFINRIKEIKEFIHI